LKCKVKMLFEIFVIAVVSIAVVLIFRKVTKISPKSFFRGKIVILTGASQGIGSELAVLLSSYELYWQPEGNRVSEILQVVA